MATLNITVQYDPASGLYSFDLSYTSNGTPYTATVADEGTVAFVNGSAGTDENGTGSTGQYTLTAASGSSQTFTFNAVNVTLGSGLGDSKSCDVCGTFSVSSIPFPAIAEGKTSRADGWSWCQSLSANAMAIVGQSKFTDPKLGLSNTTGTQPINAGFTDCDCSSCS